MREKSVQDIAKEWDALAASRDRQQERGIDISYSRLLLPLVLREVIARMPSRILDVGCGTGLLTARLAEYAPYVVGVDPSIKSISLAMRNAGPVFIAQSIEEYAPAATGSFDAVVANMTLMDVPNLVAAANGIASVLRVEGSFVFTITHPWFWPAYWGYDSAPWFDYSNEIFIEAEFGISHEKTNLVSTHVHRPLEMYSLALADAGFVLRHLAEPRPSFELESSYPEPWKFPRFLLGVCERVT